MIPTQKYSKLDLLHDANIYKGTAYTQIERDKLGLNGLLPPHVATMDEQVERVMTGLRSKCNDLDKHILLISLQERNRTLFYRVVMDHMEEIMPLIYTPTVGQACEEYAHIFRRPQGLYINIHQKGRIDDILANWSEDDIRVIVVTDGERILGLGDLGANGMGIPVGKLSLYTACAGVAPHQTLPILLDVGTNNATYLNDPLYLGLKQKRVRGEDYDAFIDEFVMAIQQRFPHALLQFEDFGNQNAFRLLKKYQHKLPTFNDDIQGTAAVTLAGLYSALHITEQSFTEQRFLFLGAGEAGIGIGELIVSALEAQGLSAAEAKRRCWFFDSKGLVVNQRDNLQVHKQLFAHEGHFITDFETAIDVIQPTAIIGVSGQPQTFTESIIRKMAQINERPLIFALSNPTSKAECTAEQAYHWSDGRAIFASGSPFDDVQINGDVFIPAQANNAYVFPGIGLGVLTSESEIVSNAMFLAAAHTLATLVTDDDLAKGRLFPSLQHIRMISAQIAVAVAETATSEGIARRPLPRNLLADIESHMYQPVYKSYI
ncbi:MAG: NAD-dependent malic enzyme [Phototrophicaceae bacterium]